MGKVERTQGNRTKVLVLLLPCKDEAIQELGRIQKNGDSQKVIAIIEMLIVIGSLLTGYLTFRKNGEKLFY